MERCKNCKYSKNRSEEEKIKLTRRLNIIEGQINGITQMVKEDRNCDDILIQISAVTKSLKSLGNYMLKTHLEKCLANDFKNHDFDSINDVINLFERVN